MNRTTLRLGAATMALSTSVVLGAGLVGTTSAQAVSGTQHGVSTVGAIPVSGTTADGGTFTGTLSNLTATSNGTVTSLTGTITGLYTDANGVTTPITDTFTATVDSVGTDGSCSVLDLDLGPLHLDLLGLVVDLNAIHLDVTAVPGSGNLLGNLLCGVAGLLDQNGGGLAGLLNRLL